MVFGIFSKDLKTYIHTYTQKTPYMMFIAALLSYPHLEATKCPSHGKWINELRYIQAIEYYLVLMSHQAMKRHGGIVSDYAIRKKPM